jgi:hypothetical protein
VVDYAAQQPLIHPLVAELDKNKEKHSLSMINNHATPNNMINLQITQLTPSMTAAVQQAAAILHHDRAFLYPFLYSKRHYVNEPDAL